jgi:hypothetical protein
MKTCGAGPPAKVHLIKGWNSIVIKLPVGLFTSAETRLVKWMFTAMVVTPDGKKQPEGLIYSPGKKLPVDTIIDISGYKLPGNTGHSGSGVVNFGISGPGFTDIKPNFN